MLKDLDHAYLDHAYLDHVGIAVHSIDKALEFYKLLGFKKFVFKEISHEKVKVCLIELKNTKIELIEPTSPDSSVSKFLKKRGEGLHQICFRVSNLKKSIEMLKKNNINLVGEPKDGAVGRVIFIHPKSANGVLVELVEVKG